MGSLLGEQTITRRRFSTPSPRRGADGRTLDPSPGVDLEFGATVDPITGDAIRKLPEGERDERQIYILTDEVDLRIASRKGELVADQVIWEGDVYEVVSVMRYRRIIPHLEARARYIGPES